ncbi:MAG TPA: DUF2846 domain-containing protein [Candidatus Binatia bacterium]|jgi:hypothetical protein
MPTCPVDLDRSARLRSVALLALLVLFAGCAPVRPRFSQTDFATQPAPADKARIIFLRLNDSYLGAEWARLGIAGATVGRLARGEFLVVDIAPGEHEISVEEEKAKGRFAFRMNFEAGQIYDMQVTRREEQRNYQATGAFAAIIKLVAPSLIDEENPFMLAPVEPWEVLKMLQGLELSEPAN